MPSRGDLRRSGRERPFLIAWVALNRNVLIEAAASCGKGHFSGCAEKIGSRYEAYLVYCCVALKVRPAISEQSAVDFSDVLVSSS
jgi:hypothetical protein